MEVESQALDDFLKGKTEHWLSGGFIFYRESGKIVAGGLVIEPDEEGKRKDDEENFSLRERLEIDTKSKQIISVNQPLEDKETGPMGYVRFDGLYVQEKTSKFDYDQFEKKFGKNYGPVIQVINGLNESYNPSSR